IFKNDKIGAGSVHDGLGKTERSHAAVAEAHHHIIRCTYGMAAISGISISQARLRYVHPSALKRASRSPCDDLRAVVGNGITACNACLWRVLTAGSRLLAVGSQQQKK